MPLHAQRGKRCELHRRDRAVAIARCVITNNESGATLSNVALTGALNLSSNVTIKSGTNLFLFSDARSNFFAGPGAGNSTTGGEGGGLNTAVGFEALSSNTHRHRQFGTRHVVSLLQYHRPCNTAGGFGALYSNTNGGFNTAYGAYALVNNGSSSNNTAVGFQSLTKTRLGMTYGHRRGHAGWPLTPEATTWPAVTRRCNPSGWLTTNTAFGYLALGKPWRVCSF